MKVDRLGTAKWVSPQARGPSTKRQPPLQIAECCAVSRTRRRALSVANILAWGLPVVVSLQPLRDDEI